MENYQKMVKIASRNSTVRKAIVLSLIVGSLLNLINQGNLILSNQITDLSIVKLCLTYLTPFAVSVYSTTTALHGKEPMITEKIS